VVRNNFGCGSSREHAVWAVAQYGFRAIIAPAQRGGGRMCPAFADIFRNNCVKNGIDPEVENDDADLNMEVAAGVAIEPFSELGILIGHMDSGYADTTEVLFYAEDTYDVGLPVLPYASAGIGYAWSKTDTEDVNSMFGELEAGVKYMVTERHALGIGAEYSYSFEDIYLDKNGVGDDHNIEFGASFSYYY
jgi:hypothetical protein